MEAAEDVFRQVTEDDRAKSEYKSLYNQGNTPSKELEARYLPFFNKLALRISGREDIPKPPAATYVVLFRDLCERDDATLKRAWIDYIIKEAKVLRRQDFESRIATALETAWNVKLVDDSATLLKTEISNMFQKTRKPLTNFCSIIQASGTGKSRTVDKVAESVFTIPIVLRPVRDKLSFPPGDTADGTSLLDFFRKQSGTAYQVELLYLQFLLKTLVFADRWIDHYIKAGRETKNIAAAWREYLGAPRSGPRKDMYAQAIDLSPVQGLEDFLHRKAIDERQGEVGRFITAIAKKIKPKTDKEPTIVFYFDEAQDLTEARVTLDGAEEIRSAYQCLAMAFRHMIRSPVFGLFISAYSPLVGRPPEPVNTWSSRPLIPLESDDNMHAPFVELPFDVWKKKIIVQEGRHSGDELCSLGFMARFGRPMFWALLEGDAVDENDVMKLAMSKLEFRDDPFSNDIVNCPFQALVPLLAARVDLSFSTRRSEGRLVERHLVIRAMRIVFSIPQHREFMRAGYPSEPFLAEAASRVMLKYFYDKTIGKDTAAAEGVAGIIAKYKEEVPSAIWAWLQGGLIEEELRMELVTRLFCTLAHDFAILENLSSGGGIGTDALDDDRVLFSPMVPVVDFLRALIAPEHIEKILKAKPGNMQGRTLEEAFKDAVVHFTQFAKIGHPAIICQSKTYFLFTRGVAMRGTEDMAGVCLVIPVWIRGGSNPTGEDMTAIFINWVRHGQATFFDAPGGFKFFTDHDEGKGKYKDDERPYISIVMEFSERGSCQPFSVDEEEVNVFSYDPAEESQLEDDDTHPRYEIHVKGCSKGVYNVVGNVSYADILVPMDVLMEQPRDRERYKLAKGLKPFWDADSCGWVKWDPGMVSRVGGGDDFGTGGDEGMAVVPDDDEVEEDVEMGGGSGGGDGKRAESSPPLPPPKKTKVSDTDG